MVMPANYAPAPEPPQKRSHKGLILIIVAILIIGAIITVAIVVFTNDNDFHRDAEQITYDSGDEETGGGKESIPKNETLDFLKDYSISNEDIQKIEMEVLFYSDIKEADIDALEKQIKLKPYIESSRVSSREENTRTAQQIIGSNFTEVISNPINASIIVNVKPQYANSDSLNKISKELKRNPIVQDVDYPDFIVKSISNNFYN